MFQVCLFFTLAVTVYLECSGGIPAACCQGIPRRAPTTLRSAISAGNYVAKGKRMPAAKTPIQNMTWDCEIEKSAQKLVDSCVVAHSTYLNNLGENLFGLWTGSATITGKATMASKYWEDEFQEYGWADVNLTRAVWNTGIGHATQMAWAKSTKIGCGMAVCDNASLVFVACQYRDAGNYINRNVYDPK